MVEKLVGANERRRGFGLFVDEKSGELYRRFHEMGHGIEELQ